jgi:hypothetical protein
VPGTSFLDAAEQRRRDALGEPLFDAGRAGYARAAGFEDVEVLPIEHEDLRFYRLR